MEDIKSMRRGFFKINRDLLEGVDLTLFMQHLCFFPTRVEFMYFSNEFEIRGISINFDEVYEGSEVPEYMIIYTQNNDMDFYKFAKIEKVNNENF